MQHLQVIKDWASNKHGVSCLKVVRVNEYRDTHGRRCRHGAPGWATQKGESVGTNGCLPALHGPGAPWIVAGQGKGEFPEAFNQIGMHTDVV